MERETINTLDYIQITAVKLNGIVKRYEVEATGTEGFFRISEKRTEYGKVYFPGTWSVEKILSDIRREAEE